jgi:hypothetical protein
LSPTTVDHAPRDAAVLSINQEAPRLIADGRLQNVVADLVKRDAGFSRVSRSPYWLRRGYVEEVFEVI